MKKFKVFLSVLIAAIVIILVWPMPAFAVWGIGQVNPGTGIVKGNYAAFGMRFTSDGNALSATDIIARIANTTLKGKVQGGTFYKMGIDPGEGGVIPNAAFDITITNYWGMSIYTGTSLSYTADSWPDMVTPMGVYPPVLNEFNIAISDIGDAGDQVTLYFYFWIE